MKRLSVICNIFLIILATNDVLAAEAQSASPEWADKPYKYIVITQDLYSVLKEFEHLTGIPVKIGSSSKGQRVSGPLDLGQDATALKFLNNICDRYGLTWYYDGSRNTLHITSSKDNDSETIGLSTSDPEDVRQQLKEEGGWDARFTFKSSANRRFLTVTGPAAYRTAVRRAVTAVERGAQIAKETKMRDYKSIRVFRGVSGGG
jgi:type III secretion protein C